MPGERACVESHPEKEEVLLDDEVFSVTVGLSAYLIHTITRYPCSNFSGEWFSTSSSKPQR